MNGNMNVKYISCYFFREGVLGYRYIVALILTFAAIGGECSVLCLDRINIGEGSSITHCIRNCADITASLKASEERKAVFL